MAGRLPGVPGEARGATVVDLDGHHVDLCLGDTGAMAGHSPAPTGRPSRGATPRPAGPPRCSPPRTRPGSGPSWPAGSGSAAWSFSLTATDANRWAIRLARLVTDRPKILVFNYCYHGTVDEAFITLDADGAASREGNVGAPVDPAATTRVVEFNDLDALDRELANGDVAGVLMEPALTNIGIVLPAPGYLEGGARADPPPRHPAHQRRDPHAVGRAGRLHPGLGPRARPGHRRQGDRRGDRRRRLRRSRPRSPGGSRPGATPT